MRARACWLALAMAGCGGSSAAVDAAAVTDAGANDAARIDAPDVRDGGADAGGAPITADEIRAAIGDTCIRLPRTGLYATDDGALDTIPICQGPTGVIYWQSDLDIDCDGGRTAVCMSDPAYMAETSTVGSDGMPIDAETVPFVVIPLPSTRFAYADHEIALGQVALVTYGNQWAIGVFADEGPDNIIGEASFAMAGLLGIDNDPVSGGVDGGATFVIFPGASARVTAVEDHDEAVRVAMPLVNALLGR